MLSLETEKFGFESSWSQGSNLNFRTQAFSLLALLFSVLALVAHPKLLLPIYLGLVISVHFPPNSSKDLRIDPLDSDWLDFAVSSHFEPITEARRMVQIDWYCPGHMIHLWIQKWSHLHQNHVG